MTTIQTEFRNRLIKEREREREGGGGSVYSSVRESIGARGCLPT